MSSTMKDKNGKDSIPDGDDSNETADTHSLHSPQRTDTADISKPTTMSSSKQESLQSSPVTSPNVESLEIGPAKNSPKQHEPALNGTVSSPVHTEDTKSVADDKTIPSPSSDQEHQKSDLASSSRDNPTESKDNTEEKSQEDHEEEESSDSEEEECNLDLTTLNHLRDELKNYQVVELLDEDDIVQEVRQLNKAALKRSYAQMEETDSSATKDDSNQTSKETKEDGNEEQDDDEENDTRRKFKLVHVVDNDFFETIADDARERIPEDETDESKIPRKKYCLDAFTLDKLKDDLEIDPHKRWSRRSKAIDEFMYMQYNTKSLLRAGGEERRLTRGMIRGRPSRAADDDMTGINELLEASKQLEKMNKKGTASPTAQNASGNMNDSEEDKKSGQSKSNSASVFSRPGWFGTSVHVSGVIVGGKPYDLKSDLKSRKKGNGESDGEDEEHPLHKHLSDYTESIETSFIDWQKSDDFVAMQLKPKADFDQKIVNSVPVSPQRRHSNNTYGKWSNQLLHCLQGKGRNMARYEFFYSDIDRVWFNASPYRRDLRKLGVPPNAKFTRSEWSLLRRKVRKKPPRFTNRFVRSQFQALKDHRQFSRTVHKKTKPTDDEKKKFDYLVSTPISVGAIVTAYCKKVQMLHRGTVLSRTTSPSTYLVQFERKELGYEECPDFDVASHGVPAMLKVSPTNQSLDAQIDPNRHGDLPYGTTYGPLSELNRATAQTKDKMIQRGPTDTERKNIDSRIERAILVKLLCIVEMATKRKGRLLREMEKTNLKFQDQAKVVVRHGEVYQASRQLRLRVISRYATWLKRCLEVTDQALQTALVHMQALYGKLYTNASKFSKKVDEGSMVAALEHVTAPISEKTTHEEKWNGFINDSTISIASLLTENVVQKANQSKVQEEARVEQGLRTKIVENRLNSVAELLTSSMQVERNSTTPSSTFEKAIETTLASFQSDRMPEMDVAYTSIQKHDLNALSEAINCLNAEISLRS